MLILHWGTRGGGPQLQEYIGKALRTNRGLELAISYDETSETAGSLRQLHVPALIVGRIRARGRMRHAARLLSQPWDAYRLWRFCRINDIDVIFEVMDHPLQVLPKIIARLAGVRVLGSVHDAVRHAGEKSRILDILSRASIRSSDGILTYSSTVATEVAAQALIPAAKVHQTVHGAFGVPGTPRTRKSDADDFVVGFFGRVERYKGLSRLLEAVRILQTDGAAVTVRIDGRGALSPSERELAALVHAEHVQRWIPECEIQSVVSGYDVLALPYDEASQSGVIGYALSAGVPIVSTPVGGLAEQVDQAKAGLVAESMSSEDFASALGTMRTEEVLYENFSRSAITSARTTFSWDRVASDVVRAAESLLTGSTKSSS
ncbi:hypothetical protein GCM10008097_06790 [Mycetocola manganoxydans]|nr:glycosyltransferase [Mycetocola manganoxydans]GHD41716.1 hypothetical protein GCM10008097_06790 [Mycetocola manganoxydans]